MEKKGRSEKPETMRQEFTESVGIVLFLNNSDMCKERGKKTSGHRGESELCSRVGAQE